MNNKTLSYFYEIMQIPRESGNEKNIAKYLINYAIKNNYEYKCDKYNNVIIYKNKKNKNKIILQAHIDMVCVSKKPDFDFNKNKICPVIKGDFLFADETSLGADNGIGVALILSLLDENIDACIEAVFTVEEETTMLGAKMLNFNNLQSNALLSFDGDNDCNIEISSAGMIEYKIDFNFEKIMFNGFKYKLVISGLKGGHSGTDIHMQRQNAILLGMDLAQKLDLKIISCVGGTRANVIPNYCELVFLSDKKIEKSIFDLTIPNEEDLKFELDFLGQASENVFEYNLISLIQNLPNGVIERYEDDFVMTSSNIAKIDTNINSIVISLRSSNKHSEHISMKNIESILKEYNCEYSIPVTSPFFESSINSKLINDLSNKYFELFNEKPNIKRVHAGLEGGVFKQKNQTLEIAVIGANIQNMHSVNENVSIKSINKIYNWVYNFLKSYSI